MVSQLAHSIFKAGIIFSIMSTGWGNILALGNPSRERDTWKGNVEIRELRCTNIQKELIILQEEVEVVNSLKEIANIHNFPSILAVCVIELEGSLRHTQKQYKTTSDFIKEKTPMVEEHHKASIQDTGSHTKTLKTLQDEVVGLKWALYKSLQHTMRDVLRVFE